MRIFWGIAFVLFLIGCENQEKQLTIVDRLQEGEWRLISSDKVYNNVRSGLLFAENMEVFNIDSQGKTIIPTHQKIYSISGDTLKMVDHKYVPNLLYAKGTEIFFIKKLTEEILVLTTIYPEKDINLMFEKLK